MKTLIFKFLFIQGSISPLPSLESKKHVALNLLFNMELQILRNLSFIVFHSKSKIVKNCLALFVFGALKNSCA